MVESPPVRSPPVSWIAAVLLLFCGVAAVAPYRTILHLFPTGADVMLWVSRMEPDVPGWWRNVFLKEHFVGYRPITALSFTLDGLLPVRSPEDMRLVDLGLYLLAGVGVYACWAALADRANRPWGVLAAAMFWSSPIAELVVPYVTRRSYTLATVFGCAAFAVSVAGIRSDRLLLTIVGSLLVALGALSNETGFVIGPVVVLAAILWAPGPRRKVAHAVPAIVVSGLAAGVRSAVIGGLGGYEAREVLLSTVNSEGERVILHDVSGLELFVAALRGGVFPENLAGDPPFLWALGGGFLIGLLFAIWALGWTGYRLRKAGDPVPALLVVWSCGYALLSVAGHVWFPRMSFGMGVPIALWLGWCVKEGLLTRTGWNLVPAGLVLAARLQVATPVWGLDRTALGDQVGASKFIRESKRTLSDVKPPALVWIATDLDDPDVESAMHWVETGLKKGVDIKALTARKARARATEGANLSIEDGVVKPEQGRQWSRAATHSHLLFQDGVDLVTLQVDKRPTWLLDDGVLTRVDQP